MGKVETPEVPAVSATDAENKPAQSPQTPTAPSQVQQAAVAIETSLQTKLGNWLKDVYNSNKILFYTIIPIMGLIFLIIKFHNVLIDILLGSSKEIIKQEQAKDASLAQEAAKTTAAGDALVDAAKKAPTQEQPVPDDWYKK